MAGELSLYLLLSSLIAAPLLFFFVNSGRRAAPRDDARTRTRLPPSPWALPVIGHLHHLAAGGRLPPHRAMRDLSRRHGPLMLLRLGEVNAVVASSPDAAREVMRTHDAAFASRPIGPVSRLWFQGADGLVFAPYGEAWRRLRRVCTVELLSHRRVLSFRPVRKDELGRLLRAVDAAATASSSSSPATVNLTEMISTYVADSTVRAIIGSRRLKDRDEYLRMLGDLFSIMPGMSLPDLFPSSRLAMLVSRAPGRIRRYRRRMRRIMESIIDEHRERRDAAAAGDEDDDDDEDLVDVLLRLQREVGEQYPLTTENIKTVMLDIFGAASETSATALEWVMAELMRSPSAMRKAQEEVRRAIAAGADDTVTEDVLPSLHYLKLVVKETLRLHPPAPLLLPRRCESPCKVLGYDVPAGATVLVNAWAIGRDPANWESPEEFMPERFEADVGGGGTRDFRGADFEFIPFGAGRRMCPGMAFGLVHVELALAALLFHFDWSLPGAMAGDELDMTESSGLTVRRRLQLLVVARPHAPLPTK